MYSNPHWDPTVKVKDDRNGTACPHCDWRFLTDHGLTNHMEKCHPAADLEQLEVKA